MTAGSVAFGRVVWICRARISRGWMVAHPGLDSQHECRGLEVLARPQPELGYFDDQSGDGVWTDAVHAGKRLGQVGRMQNAGVRIEAEVLDGDAAGVM